MMSTQKNPVFIIYLCHTIYCQNIVKRYCQIERVVIYCIAIIMKGGRIMLDIVTKEFAHALCIRMRPAV